MTPERALEPKGTTHDPLCEQDGGMYVKAECDCLERERDALRAENAHLTARYVALKEDADADAEKLSQALSDAGDAIAERNQARHALRESQEENARLTLAASESARTLQVEMERLREDQRLTNEDCRAFEASEAVAWREVRTKEAQVAALREAIEWALGMGEVFRPREPGQGAYWWRTELWRRSGLPNRLPQDGA